MTGQLGLFSAAPKVVDWFAAPPAAPTPVTFGSRRPRWYQREIKRAGLEALKSNRSTLVVAATGTGKTFSFCDFAREWKGSGQVLVLAHRDEIIRQTIASLKDATGGEAVGIEKAEEQSDGERYVVGSIQSFNPARCARLGKGRFSLVIVDECFPAGTLVDGRPIENIRPGERVLSIDHETGNLELRKVERVFARSSYTDLVTVTSGALELTCTKNHPLFVKGTGYVRADEVLPGDLLCVFQAVHGDEVAPQENMLGLVSSTDILGDHGEYQPCPRFGSDDRTEPHEERQVQREDVVHAEANGPRSEDSGRQRHWTYELSVDAAGDARGSVGGGVCGTNESTSRFRVSYMLQAGPGPAVAKVWSGARRGQSLFTGAPGPGPQEGCALAWSRVDSVARKKLGCPRTVYNLEVEGSHTYFANGALVHNCHHSTAPTYKRVLEYFDAPIIGFTATPDRSDEKALGQVFESVAYTYEILDAINDGFLCPVDAHQVHLESVDLSHIETVGGDLSLGELDEEMFKSVEGVTKETLRLSGDRQGIVFWPGVKSAEAACVRFNALKPGCSEWVYAKTPKEERHAIIKAFRAGEVQFIHNVGVLTEGFDAPESSVVAVARPTKSRGLLAQMIGRGLRPPPGVIDHWLEKDEAPLRLAAIAASRKPNAMILDFAGNAGKHSLARTTDVLGGDYSEAEVELAKKKVSTGMGDVQAALKAARAELEAQMKRAQSQVKARVVKFDPFAIVDADAKQADRYTQRFGFVAATPKQVEALRKFGLTEADGLKDFSKMAAAKMLDTLIGRAKGGLAGYKQLKRFRAFGVTETRIPRAVSDRAMDYIAKSGWDRANPVEVNRIISNQRTTGEEG